MSLLTRLRRLFRPDPTPTGLAIQQAMNGDAEALRAIMREVDAVQTTYYAPALFGGPALPIGVKPQSAFKRQYERVRRGEAPRDARGRFVAVNREHEGSGE